MESHANSVWLDSRTTKEKFLQIKAHDAVLAGILLGEMVNVFSCLHKSEAPAPSLTNDLRICQALTNLYKEVRIALELIKKLFSIETKKNHTLMWNMDGSSVRPVGSILETSLEHDGVEEEEKKKGKRRRRKRKRNECRLVDIDV